MPDLAPLWMFADVRPSSVDKKSKPHEHTVRLVGYTDVCCNEVITPELELMGATANSRHIDRFRLLPGDVIITNSSGAPEGVGVPAHVEAADDDMVCAHDLTLLRPWKGRACSKFLYWVLESRRSKGYWLTSTYGVAQYSIRSDVVSRFPVPNFDINTQRAIAAYLDRETCEIDMMITKMDDLVDALNAKRKSAVAECLEAECQHSPMIPLGVASPFMVGAAPPADNGQHFGEGIALANISDLGPKIIYETARSVVRQSSETAFFGPMAKPGDLLVSFNLSVGAASIVGAPMLANGSIAIFRPGGSLEMRFAYYMLPLYLRKAAYLSLFGASSLNGGIMRRTRVPVPPRDAQRRIADHLDEATDKIDAMLAKVAELRSLLIERRAVLITDVVIGRKAVA